MDIDSARDLFGEQDDYYNTIFSNKDLKIPSGRLYATTTKEDIEKSADVFMQMMVSMVITITIVSTLIFILVMYLMMKVMIDRSAYSISLMKVFGFGQEKFGNFIWMETFILYLFPQLSIYRYQRQLWIGCTQDIW